MADFRRQVLLRAGTLAVSVFGLVGCNGTTAAPTLVSVEGKVTLAGKMVSDGSITFVPADESVPPPWPESPIAANGSYVLQTGGRPGAAPGSYRAIFQPGDEDKATAILIDPRYCNARQTPLQIEVGEGRSAGAYDLALKARTKR